MKEEAKQMIGDRIFFFYQSKCYFSFSIGPSKLLQGLQSGEKIEGCKAPSVQHRSRFVPRGYKMYPTHMADAAPDAAIRSSRLDAALARLRKRAAFGSEQVASTMQSLLYPLVVASRLRRPPPPLPPFTASPSVVRRFRLR